MEEPTQGMEGPGCHPTVTGHARAHPGTQGMPLPVHPALDQAVSWPEPPGAGQLIPAAPGTGAPFQFDNGVCSLTTKGQTFPSANPIICCYLY